MLEVSWYTTETVFKMKKKEKKKKIPLALHIRDKSMKIFLERLDILYKYGFIEHHIFHLITRLNLVIVTLIK